MLVRALQSNPEEVPQVLSDTTSVCSSSQGRTSACEVELDVPTSCIIDDGSFTSDCPIVFYFHGAGGTNDWFGRTSGVHVNGVIGVYPQGENGWNTGPKDSNTCTWDNYDCTSDPDEGAFIALIISELRLQGANGNIYLVGNSNGAALSHRLAANGGNDLPIKGIVTKVTQLLSSPERNGPGVLNYNQPGAHGGPAVSVLNLMGDNDLLINYEGGMSGVFGTDPNFVLMNALDSMTTWATHNGCNAQYTIGSSVYSTNNEPNGLATFYDYSVGCPEGIIVEHYALHGAGHSFGAGAALDGVTIDHALAHDFIARVEAGDNGGGGGGGTPTTAAPVTANPSSSPIEVGDCVDDSTWAGKFNPSHTCEWVGESPAGRCGAESLDGTLASSACKVTCGTCLTNSPTVSVTTLAPTTASPTCGSSPMSLYDFEDSSTDLTVSPFAILGGSPQDPWSIDASSGGCDGSSSSQVTAGAGGNGVNRNSILSIDIPPGATFVSYYYSHPGGLNTGDGEVFLSRMAGVNQEQYQNDVNPVTCAQSACLAIPNGAATIEFRCRTRKNGQLCSIDQVQFSMDISTLSPTLNPTKVSIVIMVSLLCDMHASQQPHLENSLT